MTNKPIKFRAWTGATMEYDVIVGKLGAFYCAGMDPQDSACLSPANTIYGEKTPIMQWTGLLDKNGREIYEGDILKHEYLSRYYSGRDIKNGRDSGAKYSEEKHPFFSIYQILWVNESYEINCGEYQIPIHGWAKKFIFDNKHIAEKLNPYGFGGIEPFNSGGRYEVVGNIYENPGLLTPAK